MKNFITTVAALLATTSFTAQAQSEWEPDEDITQYLEWGAYDGTTKGDDSWTWSSVPGYGYAEWEFFNQPNGTEFYQIFNLPAGYYEFNVQAFYRGNDWQNTYWSGNYSSAAEFFASTGDYNDDGDFEVTRDNFVPIVSLASSEVTGGRLYEASDWQSDVEYTPTNKSENYYAPNSMAGARAYFDEGYYNTNNLRVIQKEDGPIKIGIRKNANSASNDWVLWSNFTATYLGEAGDAVLRELALEKLETAISKAESLEDNYADYPALQALYQDTKEELATEGRDAEDVETIEAITAKIEQLIEDYKKYRNDAIALTKVISASEKMAQATDYPGKPGFEASIADAKKVSTDGEPEAVVVKEPTDYAKALNTLGNARAEYVMSIGAAADGSYDFTNVVAYPWFCNIEYNPTYNAENNKWEYPDVVINGNDEKKGWGSIGEASVEDTRVEGTDTLSMFNMSSDVTIGTDTAAVLAWYQTGTADWNRYVPYWNMQLTSCKHWATPGDRHEIAQNLVGLPDGYYSLKGKGVTWSNDWGQNGNADVKMGIFFKANGKTTESEEVAKKSGWWGDVSNQDAWNNFTTPMVEVKGGQARVGFFNNGFGAFTGMQLTYYGANPNFTAMISEQVEAIKNGLDEKLILMGDQAAVNNILAEIPAEIIGFDAYEVALGKLAEVNDYITTASNYINNNDVTAKASELQAKYDAESAEALALEPVINESMEIFNREDATYKDVQAFSATIDAYEHYFNTEKSMAAEISTDEMTKKIAEQLQDLSNAFADNEKLQGFEQELSIVRTHKILSDLNLNNATENNPVDITAILKNPSFTNGNTGWDGDVTVDKGLESAERYNTNFDVSQTVYALPAGAYEVQVKAFYRDGNISSAFNHIYNADDENAYTPNAKLYANTRETDLVSICNMDAQFKDRSFTRFVYKQEELDENEFKDLYERCEERDSISTETGETVYVVTSYQEELQADGSVTEKTANDAWIYDSWNFDGDERYFYPNSMRGATARFKNNGGAYTNTLQVMVGEDGILKFGLKKNTTIGDDWCMFDDFKLFYLGTETPNAINGTNTGNNAKAQQIFSADGRQMKTMQKGLNIVKMSDGTVRKVMVK